ncbi:MAG: hypothetical protein ACI9B8_000340, partial [Sulfitobacter sp.]
KSPSRVAVIRLVLQQVAYCRDGVGVMEKLDLLV